MSLLHRMSVLMAASAMGLGAVGAYADEVADQGRALLTSYKDAVVTVEIVTSISWGGEKQENESWSNGVIINPAWLTVLSLSAVDPLALYSAMGESIEEATSQVVSLTLLMSGNKEIPCEVVVRDRDLDLAMVRPLSPPETPMTYVDITKVGEPQILDEVLVLAQLGEVARRAHTAMIDRIETVVEKPRKYYVMGEHRANTVISAPVFTLDGGFVGMGVMRAIRSKNGGGMGDNVLVIIVAAKDIQTMATHVPEKGEGAPSGEAAPDAEPETPESPDAPASPETPEAPAEGAAEPPTIG